VSLSERRTSFREVVRAAGPSAARTLATGHPERLVIDFRDRARTVVFECPCTCGDLVMIAVDPEVRRSWEVRLDGAGRLSLIPSVWRTSGCRSHFILWHNRVWWCSRDEWDEWDLDAAYHEMRDGARFDGSPDEPLDEAEAEELRNELRQWPRLKDREDR
jgi:hypothetical protein